MAEQKKATTHEIGRPGLTYSGGGLFPYSQMLDDREYAPDVRWPKSVTTYRRMQTDAQIKGLLMATTLPIRRMRWEIDPNGAKPEVVAHVCRSLNLPVVGADAGPRRRRNRFNFDRHMAHAFQALTYGHYYFEETYEFRDPREGGDGLLHLAKLGTRPPRTILDIPINEDGSLKGIQQNIFVAGGGAQAGGATFGPLIGSERLLAYLWDTEDDGDWVGKSMLRACLRHWLVKDALIRVDVAKHQRNGMGVPWFEVHPDASDDQVKELAAIAERWRAGEASGGAGPGKAHLVGVDGQLPDTIKSVRYHDEQMSKAFLVLFFNLGGDATSGSKALGSEFIDWYVQGQDTVAFWFRDSTQEQIEKEVEFNWGEDEQPPALVCQRMETDELSFADLVKGYESGLIALGSEEEDAGDQQMSELGAYIAQRWHLPRGVAVVRPPAAAPSPTPTPSDPAAAPAARQPARSAAATTLLETIDERMTWPHAARAAGMDPKGGTARRARDQLVQAGALKRHSDGTLAPMAGMQLPDRELRREATQAEVDAAVDFAAMEQVYTTGRETLVEAVKAAQGAQIDELAEAVEAAAGDPAQLASLTVEPVPIDLIEEHLLEVAAAGVASAREERQAQLAPSAGADPAPEAATEPEPDQEAIDRAVHERSEAVALTLAAGLAVSASKRAASVSTLPPETAAADVREHLASLSGAALEEQLGGAVMQGYNTGRREFFRVAGPNEVFASEIMDGNTCSACVTIDGTTWPSVEAAEGDYPVGGYAYCEGGLRCRGVLVAVY